MVKYSFGVIGGGKRYAELRRLLEADGQRVFSYGAEADAFSAAASTNVANLSDTAASPDAADAALQAALNAEIVILPLPLCGEDGFLNCSGRPLSIQEIFDRVQGFCIRKAARTGDPIPAAQNTASTHSARVLIAGLIPQKWIAEAERRGLALIDYMRREPLAVANASATAEAALQVTMEHLEEALAGKECLILGFGRIGKLLAHRLQGLSARVTVAARRREDRAWIRAYGYEALDIHTLSGNLSKFEIVYNTIPAPVLDQTPLAELPPDCLLIDLASKTGIDFPAAAELGLRTVWARGLPGHLLPRTAAAIIQNEIYEILRETIAPSAEKTG